MKAVVVTAFGGPDVLKVIEKEIPDILPTQVRFRVAAASVNFADLKARKGVYHGVGQPPFIPGLDAAGIIDEVGTEVTRFKKGDRVIAFPKNGSYAEFAVAEEALTFAISDGIDFETAAACPTVAFTTFNLLHQLAQIEENETVLIHSASGGIGTTGIQMARLLGAKKVIGTVGNNEKKETVMRAGADDVFNYQEEDFVTKTLELTDGKGADIILDSVGGEIFDKSLDCLAMFGRIVNFGSSGGSPGTSMTNALHASCRSVLGYSLGTYLKHRPERLQYTASKVLPLIEEKKITMVVNHRFSLEEAADAHALVESRKSTGKILLLP